MFIGVVNRTVGIGPAMTAEELKAFAEDKFPGGDLEVMPIFPGSNFLPIAPQDTPQKLVRPEFLNRTPGSFVSAEEMEAIRDAALLHLGTDRKRTAALQKTLGNMPVSALLNRRHKGTRVSIARTLWDWLASQGVVDALGDLRISDPNVQPPVEVVADVGLMTDARDRAEILQLGPKELVSLLGVDESAATEFLYGAADLDEASARMLLALPVVADDNGHLRLL